MIGQDKIFATIEKVMASSKGDQTEAVFTGSNSGLTRYANSFVHQNVAVENSKVSFKVVVDQKIGTASCNSFTVTDLRKALRAAFDIAKRQKPNPDFDGLAKPSKYAETETFDQKTAKFTPKQRATKLKRVFSKGAKYDYEMAGAFATEEGEIAVLNSNGVRCYQPYTSASINTIATGENSSGYASGMSKKVDDIDVSGLATVAVKKCRKSRNPKDIKPGTYEVILEPAAIGELFEWMNFIAFGSKAFEEKSSFLADRIGERVMGENISIYDDALDPSSPGIPFDFEGVPKKRVDLVKNGIATGVVHNIISAKRAGIQSTGHGLPPEYSAEGALPANIAMVPGDKTLDELIGEVENGLLVTRFHYINGFLDPRVAMMTGMTRDGLFRIKGGKLRGGVKNLRFTDSMMDVFSNVLGMTSDRSAIPAWGATSSFYLPAMRVGKFKFTGKTDF